MRRLSMTGHFRGVSKLDVNDSKPDWTPYTLKPATAGAPNILWLMWPRWIHNGIPRPYARLRDLVHDPTVRRLSWPQADSELKGRSVRRALYTPLHSKTVQPVHGPVRYQEHCLFAV